MTTLLFGIKLCLITCKLFILVFTFFDLFRYSYILYILN